MNMRMKIFGMTVSCLVLAVMSSFAEGRLESPYYTFPRTGNRHMDLSQGWTLVSTDSPVADVSVLEGMAGIDVKEPSSVQMSYYRAGKLPAPYAHLNSKQYEFLEQKVHYYVKSFVTPNMTDGDFAILTFDGVDYTSRVWVNGHPLGVHEGMFGGPTVRVDSLLDRNGGKNTVVLEVRSANYGIPDFHPYKTGRFIHSWFYSKCGDGVNHFFHHGMWKGARLEILSPYHLERPFMTTRSIKDGTAVIDFETEIFSGRTSGEYSVHPCEFSTMLARGAKVVDDDVKVAVRFMDGGNIAYEKQFEPTVIKGRCWMEESFELDSPKLWYPNLMGSQNMYKVSVILYVNGVQTDQVDFDFGVRTIEHVRTAGVRLGDKWNNWQYVINGEKIFLKGMNWMPVDALSDLSYANYEWAIRAARDMGIQMFRIWGTGALESETFYDLCNRYGIMVWQDFPIANCETVGRPQDIWECQVCQNIFRLRNQPSLAVWCGGNEFDAYSTGNSLLIGVLERSVRDFDPSRPFFRTSPDGGSYHIYIDFDPNNYKTFKYLPYISESGIHCMSSARNNRKIIAAEDFENLTNISDESFRDSHPDFVHHFAEYNPNRVPRMMSRASHIDDMSNPVYENMVEATQVGAGEFYQIMSEGVQSNYPLSVGLMPWVFKRPWPVVAAIELMDAFGQPTAPYYFLKRTYEKTHVMIDFKKMLYAPGDEISLETCVLNGAGCGSSEGTLYVKIYDDSFNEMFSASENITVEKGTSVTRKNLGDFKVPDNYRRRFFFIVAKLTGTDGKTVSRSVYWPRTIPQMEDAGYSSGYLKDMPVWPTLTEGPWLKPTVAAHKTVLEIEEHEATENGIRLKVVNKGKYPSLMTMIETDKGIYYSSDNFFCLEPGESKEITVDIRPSSNAEDIPASVAVSSWNARRCTVEITKELK